MKKNELSPFSKHVFNYIAGLAFGSNILPVIGSIAILNFGWNLWLGLAGLVVAILLVRATRQKPTVRMLLGFAGGLLTGLFIIFSYTVWKYPVTQIIGGIILPAETQKQICISAMLLGFLAFTMGFTIPAEKK